MRNKGFILPEALLCIFITFLIITLLLSVYKTEINEKRLIENEILLIEESFQRCLKSIIVENIIEDQP